MTRGGMMQGSQTDTKKQRRTVNSESACGAFLEPLAREALRGVSRGLGAPPCGTGCQPFFYRRYFFGFIPSLAFSVVASFSGFTETA
jgi:hypothetical protein